MKKMKTVLLPITGFLALLWFLIRVIPRPSRAAYPCQRAAFPLASGFVIWLVSILSSVFVFKRVKKIHQGRVFAGMAVAFIAGLMLFTQPASWLRAEDEPFTPTDPPNSPMGAAYGIHPGRVVWAYEPDAANWNGSGYWWQPKNNDLDEIEEMWSQSLQALTGETTDAAAWDVLFQHFNTHRRELQRGYENGEKIAVKLNLNACGDHGNNQNRFFSHPDVVLALLRQLVENAGVSAANITFYDATRAVPSGIYDPCKAEYPDVTFADWYGGDGRKRVQPVKSKALNFSHPLTLEDGGGNPVWLPQCVAEADYLINLGQLKGHNLAGITLNAKNWFGSIMSYPSSGSPQSSAPKNAGFHPYICVHSDFHFSGHWDFDKRAMETYNVLVDLMGNKDLGLKTLLFVVDGLYSAPDQSTALKTSHKWQSQPFNNDWPSSLFLSQDMVAIESVCLDFLRNEDKQTWVRGNIDNYLHEAAQADAAPSGIAYAPNAEGAALASLGVHEHWNNAIDKQYTRNLGTGTGIELVRAETATAVENRAVPATSQLLTAYPNPFNAGTTISFELETAAHVHIEIFDVRGRRLDTLVEQSLPAGSHQYRWNADAGRLPSGVYFLAGQIGNKVIHQSICLLK